MNLPRFRSIGMLIAVVAVSIVAPSAFYVFKDAITPHFDPVGFGLPATAREVVNKRTEKAVTFEVSSGKFASVSTGNVLKPPSCEQAILSKICGTISFIREIIPYALATSQGPNNPGTLASVANGFSAWSNPGNAATSDDVYATIAAGSSSEILKATSFGFSIPSGATIDGIIAEVERKSSSATGANDLEVNIVKANVLGSTNKALGPSWSTTEQYVMYGANNDLWGETWAFGDINDVNFGFAMTVSRLSGRTLSVDHIRITVYYTVATAEAAPFFSWWSLTLMLAGCGLVFWKEGYFRSEVSQAH